jgi:hypothetical protein
MICNYLDLVYDKYRGIVTPLFDSNNARYCFEKFGRFAISFMFPAGTLLMLQLKTMNERQHNSTASLL